MGEFVTDGDKPSYLPYDIIPMNASQYLTAVPSTASQTACQAACSGNAKCQYFVWYSYSADTTGNDQCFLRLATDNIVKLADFAPTTSTNTVLFEAKQGLYAVYAAKDAADADNIGTTLTTGNWATVSAYCGNTAACVGMAVGSSANTWRAFAGAKWEGAVAKVRVVGPTLNSWVAEPVA